MPFVSLSSKNRNYSVPFSVPVADDQIVPESKTIPPSISPLDAWDEPEGALAVDVYMLSEVVVIRTAVAGVKPEDLGIALQNDLLTIRGRRHDELEVESAAYVVQECHWGSFSRSIVLPVAVQPESAEAILKNGILTITIRRALPRAISLFVVDNIE